ncbi:THAP domain-containing protein 5-like [Plutella xylostella]|uniref:THAP domain-containing protein 5-like n=1 Tax=Plutella xylostella TaxID=51655 RepID=UPI002032B34A|nr:THAP domain-containing protein 5-like [Plutella xylostella]
MRVCALNVCRNYKGRLKTTHKVTYHLIPNDPIIRSKWVEIIRKSRGEDYWKPAKSTVICSDHFHHKDLYYTKNQTGLRRLKKGVLPSKALFVLPAKSEESASSGEEAEAISEGFSKQPTPSTSNQYEKKTTETDDQPIFPSTPKTSKVEQTEIEDFSDLDSVFDTPKKPS